MKTFKDFAAADVQNVFLNLNEFADFHDIDGEKIKCVIDKNIISKIPEDGLVGDFINMTTLYADSKDLKKDSGCRLTIPATSSSRSLLRGRCSSLSSGRTGND